MNLKMGRGWDGGTGTSSHHILEKAAVCFELQINGGLSVSN